MESLSFELSSLWRPSILSGQSNQALKSLGYSDQDYIQMPREPEAIWKYPQTLSGCLARQQLSGKPTQKAVSKPQFDWFPKLQFESFALPNTSDKFR